MKKTKQTNDNPHKAEDFESAKRVKGVSKGAIDAVLGPHTVVFPVSVVLEEHTHEGQIKKLNKLIQEIEILIKKNINNSSKEDRKTSKEKNISRLLQLISRIEKIEV